MTHTGSAHRDILIVTQSFDPHADEVLVQLRYMGEEPLRVNTEAIPAEAWLSYSFARGKAAPASLSQERESRLAPYTLFIDGRAIEAQQIGAVLWRRPAPYQFVGTLSPDERTLALSETEQAVQAFWLALDAHHTYWMSAPTAITASRNLPEQLLRARRFGFATPRALLTTRANQVRSFYEETGGQVVYRMLSSLSLLAQSGRSTSLVPSALVGSQELASFESMVSVPCLFYERLPARRFCILVLMGEQVFAAHTSRPPSLEEVPHWWSPQVTRLSYEPVTLPSQLCQRSLAFVQSYGLEFAVLVLAEGEDDELYFASLDPVGSFLWLEQQCPDLRMLQALAQHLIKGAHAES